MKSTFVIVALLLSIIALAISLTQPILTLVNRNGQPSFDMSRSGFYVFDTYTIVSVRNNGTATAHDVNVELRFAGNFAEGWAVNQFVPEIEANHSVTLEIPVGRLDLELPLPLPFNVTALTAYININCKELSSTTSFQFQPNIP